MDRLQSKLLPKSEWNLAPVRAVEAAVREGAAIGWDEQIGWFVLKNSQIIWQEKDIA